MWKTPKFYLATACLLVSACGPAIDYTKSERVPIEILDVKVLREWRGQITGDIHRDTQFKIKNSSQYNCKLMCVEYREGFLSNRIGRACTALGDYPPLTFTFINASGPYLTSPFNAWCYTNIVYIEQKK